MKREVFFFLVAGGFGFLVDAGGVFVLTHLYDLPPIIARAPCFMAAILTTFVLNRTLTFQHGRSLPLLKSFVKYMSANGLGQGGNFAIYTALVSSSAFFRTFPVLAVGIGSAIAAFFSFFMFKYIVFKPHDQNS